MEVFGGSREDVIGAGENCVMRSLMITPTDYESLRLS
jgi:hypothetical protein